MKNSLLPYLACPHCSGDLQCRSIEEVGGEIKEGALRCEQCSREFPISNFIPRFVKGDLLASAQQTQRAWGYQWHIFNELHSSYRNQFLDWIDPIKPDFFQGKVIADAGCGMGRFTRLAAEFGAKEIIGFDLSVSVEAAWELSSDFPNLHYIQANIYLPPLKKKFNYIYSIGVLHHLPDPYRGFHSLCGLLKKDGAISAWVYGEENNGIIIKYLNPIRENITSRIPHRLLYYLTFLLNIPIHIILKIFYHPVETHAGLKFLYPFLPYRDYLFWLARYSFRHNHQVIFDHLVAPIAFYISRSKFKSWFTRKKLEEISITPRNNNSWRGFGIRKRTK